MFAEGGERGVPGRRPLDLSAASRIWPNYFPQVEFALEDRKLKLVVLLADFFCTPQADPFLSQVQDDRGTFFLPIDMQHFQKACGVDEFYAVLEEAPKEALSCMGAAVHMVCRFDRYRSVRAVRTSLSTDWKKRENLERLRRQDADFSITWGEESLGDIAEVSRGRK
ncbi:hypothetical protein B296_00044221, partial [Ensete ventricosum]